MLLLGVTLLLLGAWYFFVAALAEGPLPSRAVLVGVGTSGQIVLTSTALGATGFLTPWIAVGANLAIAAALVAAPFRLARRKPGLLRILAADARSLGKGAAAAFGWEIAALTLILGFAALWLGTAVAYYPPRGIDDLVYHLPPVYQAVQDHRISILPIALRNIFAFPLAGEMTFLWVVLLDGSTRWVDGAQAVFALFGMAAVFALGRRFGLSPRGAALGSALFGAMPVVLLQATSNYVDLISNVWLLAAAVALLRYEESGCRIALALGGLAGGLFVGTKYQAVLSGIVLATLAGASILRLERTLRARTLAGGLATVPALAACAYWYLRNWAVFGNPFYPLPVRLFGATLFAGPWEQGPSTWTALFADPLEVFRIAVWDPGLGSFHGGFGFLFWGCSVPAMALTFTRLAREDGRGRPGRLLVLGLVPAGFVTLFLAPHDQLWLTPRYVLSVGGLASIAIALLAEEAARRRLGAATLLRGTAVLGAFLSLMVAAPASWPLLNLQAVAEDTPEARPLTELRYLKATAWDLRPMSGAWAPLDAMTRGGAGLSVYQAADYSVFWTAPTYGVELQNRIWNFESDPPSRPDAFFFHSPKGTPFYLRKEISRTAVVADPDYRLVASDGDDATTLYVSLAALAAKGRRARLVDYYRRVSRGVVNDTAQSAVAIEPGSVVLAPFPLAAGYLVHEADGRLRAEVEPITTKDLAVVAARWAGRVIYTAGVALPGMKSSSPVSVPSAGGIVALVRNEPLGFHSAGSAGSAGGGGR